MSTDFRTWTIGLCRRDVHSDSARESRLNVTQFYVELSRYNRHQFIFHNQC